MCPLAGAAVAGADLLPGGAVGAGKLPPDKRGKLTKPVITPAEFQSLLLLIPELYASMVYIGAYTGLRVSELAALKWENIHRDSITVAARYSKGD